MPRPKGFKVKEVTRNKRLDVRLTEAELVKLNSIADTMGICRTDAIMAGLDKLQEEIEKW